MSKEIKHHIGDKDIQVILGNLLRTGVILSMVVVLAGGIFYLTEHASESVNYTVFKPENSAFASVLAILKGVVSLKSKAVIQFGVLLLIFTPIVRIVFSIFSFILEKDYMYVIIGLIVLGIIMTSLNGGLAG